MDRATFASKLRRSLLRPTPAAPTGTPEESEAERTADAILDAIEEHVEAYTEKRDERLMARLDALDARLKELETSDTSDATIRRRLDRQADHLAALESKVAKLRHDA